MKDEIIKLIERFTNQLEVDQKAGINMEEVIRRRTMIDELVAVIKEEILMDEKVKDCDRCDYSKCKECRKCDNADTTKCKGYRK